MSLKINFNHGTEKITDVIKKNRMVMSNTFLPTNGVDSILIKLKNVF